MHALIDRGLSHRLPSDREQAIQWAKEGTLDVAMESSTMILQSAFGMFGPRAMLAHRCPVCAFGKIIDNMADFMAMKYRALH